MGAQGGWERLHGSLVGLADLQLLLPSRCPSPARRGSTVSQGPSRRVRGDSGQSTPGGRLGGATQRPPPHFSENLQFPPRDPTLALRWTT